ncbi:M20 aminoacylase family protein [Achromobacter piechaudii]|uniref:Hippurate hydrolase n=1 Tax=Achromobacter piechaudii TaxID=72556 RepID=A0ABN7EXH5_9BURK|nr:M20 aminoacylase family protein [Achromobacter piechaudii]CAB3672402.1 Hippurate hydrolase [Achromobacter piechaudii]CAB3837096.1 Hippurate hydrolase [Achromobacter piechaudii]CAB3943005.1 Hippurate hydrolase [Achromobacter piechaudii]
MAIVPSPLDPALLRRMQQWRHDLHAHPETAFSEFRTADLVARELERAGAVVHRGLGKTGVVGTFARGDGPVIGLRADMDALDMQELGEPAHRSSIAGKMHGCGHDGHTAMLLGAAHHLAADPGWRGTLHLIFQPAEEHAGGGLAMVRDGLFDRYDCQAVFALHNSPNLPFGTVSTRVGTVMANCDTYEITVTGKGCHAAQPEHGVDPIVAAAQVVIAMQTIVSRNVKPTDALALSLTQIHAGDTWNVVPNSVMLRGSCRSLTAATRQLAERRLREVCAGVALSSGAAIDVQVFRGYPACINTQDEVQLAVRAAARVVGQAQVDAACTPRMGSEDFAYMLEQRPGAYVFLGAARPGQENPPVHNPYYDFNDDILPLGAHYWIELVKEAMPA